MLDKAFFSRGFDYDLWANSQWWNCLVGKGFTGPDAQIFAHVFAAQEVWLRRIHGESLSAMPEVEPSAGEMERLHSGWIGILDSTTENRIIDYRRTTGEEQSLQLGDILRHVLNHGTYHRGELRGLCRARGDDDFPETDYARFAFLSPVRN